MGRRDDLAQVRKFAPTQFPGSGVYWGLRVQELRGVQVNLCRVQGSGFRVQGAGCRVQGAGCRVQGSGRRVQG